jgi:hypothetical protein
MRTRRLINLAGAATPIFSADNSVRRSACTTTSSFQAANRFVRLRHTPPVVEDAPDQLVFQFVVVDDMFCRRFRLGCMRYPT